MSRYTDIIIVVSAVIVLLLILPRLNTDNGRYINCTTVEFNPDFTPAMRETCRQMRNGYVNRSK
jgi:hypothetical protein